MWRPWQFDSWDNVAFGIRTELDFVFWFIGIAAVLLPIVAIASMISGLLKKPDDR